MKPIDHNVVEFPSHAPALVALVHAEPAPLVTLTVNVSIHPRYAHAANYRMLRGELADDLTKLSFEALAQLSWVVGPCV